MDTLSQRLRRNLHGRICVMGVGNVDYFDDGFGVYLAEELVAAGVPDVLIGGTTPEHYMQQIAEGGFDHLLLIDATNFCDTPGTVVVLTAAEIATAFPQISTHKISLGVLARVVEGVGTRVWLLGVQPESLQEKQGLSDSMETALELIHAVLRDLRRANAPEGEVAQIPEKVMAS
jgi:hydrogenase maturation protease